jgi:hypothetical protein
VKQEDLTLGMVVYLARVVDVGHHTVKDEVVVEKYTVTKAGKTFFELKSDRSRLAGAYRNMGNTLSKLEISPAAAVDNLEKRKIAFKKIHEEQYAHKMMENEGHMQLLQEWRNKRGL